MFGGSFDPIHLGHTMLARRAVAEIGLDRLIFVPCRQSPHKTEATAASAAQRCEMIRLATAEFDWAELSTVELDRDTPSFSWQTAKRFAAQNPGAELFWILGSDQWNVIETWAKPEILARLLTFLVFPRGAEPETKPGFRQQLLDYRHPASSTASRSSRESAREFLHPSVFEFVVENGLYQTGNGSA